MRVAVLLPGMLRNFEVTFPKFKQYIIDQLNADIFFSGYPNNRGIEYCEEKLVELYNPKKYILREYTDELRREICPNENKYISRKNPETNPHTWISGIWNVKQANELRKQYEKENNIKYDLVFKSRIDFFFYSSISKNDLELALQDKILIPNAWDFKSVNPWAVSDAFALTTPKVMDIYASLYDYIDTYFDRGDRFHPESLVGRHIQEHSLDRVEIIGDIPNPFGDWGCGWAIAENIENLSDTNKMY
jgi:hypothetical protein